MIQVLEFWVPGAPKTKGSLTARAPKCHCSPQCRGYARLPQLRDSEGSKRWRKLVAYQAEQAMRGAPFGWPMAGPVAVDLAFGLLGDTLQAGAGDLDKLERNVLDAMTDAGVYVDDVQVVRMVSSKHEGEPGVNAKVLVFDEYDGLDG